MKLSYFSINVALAYALAIHPVSLTWGQTPTAATQPPTQSPVQPGPSAPGTMLSSNPLQHLPDAPLSFKDVGFSITLPEVARLRLALGFTERQLQAERLQKAETQLAQVCAAVLGEMKLDPGKWNCHQDGTVKRAQVDPASVPTSTAPPAGQAGKKEVKEK